VQALEAGVSWSVARNVRFDWTGSLRVVRRLWALADEITKPAGIFTSHQTEHSPSADLMAPCGL
jgi:hypothetical protein